jgi:hypothetical protein
MVSTDVVITSAPPSTISSSIANRQMTIAMPASPAPRVASPTRLTLMV